MEKKSLIRKKLSLVYPIVLVMLLSVSCDFNDKFYHPLKFSKSKNTLTVETPTDSLIIQIEKDNFQPHFTTNGKDTAKLGYTVESVIFKSSNGNKLNGWLLKPIDTEAYITLLHFHGTGNCIYYHFQLIAPILDNGFQVFMFDYSGYGFSEGDATRKNIYKDANSSLDYIKSRPDVRDTKLVIYGQSMGGHLAAAVSSKRQKDIDALVIEGAFSSHKDMAVYGSGKIAKIFARILVKEGYNGFKSIRDYKKPLLVIYSKDDKLIPIEMGKKIFNNANEPKEFYEIEKEHIRGIKYYDKKISAKIKKMLK